MTNSVHPTFSWLRSIANTFTFIVERKTNVLHKLVSMNRNLEKKPLFDEESDVEEESLNLKTNKDYAKKFNSLREKELYKKCEFDSLW